MGVEVRPGAVIDGFRVAECIHNGGTGAIYSVLSPEDADPGFPLVMKVPRIGRGESTLGIESFEVEQMILPALRGPHVPRVAATGDVTTTPYIVMERIDGVSLASVVASGPRPPEEVTRIGAALADALQSIHSQDVVHLDLKPENVMLRPGGDAVLLDFGFSRHAHYPDLLGEEQHFAAGSAAYVSPEQLQDDRSDSRSDLYALGVLLYELATGEPPFGEPATLTGMRDRLWRAPVPPRALGRRFRRGCRRSSCIASRTIQGRATSRARTWPSTCATPTRSSCRRARNAPRLRASCHRSADGGGPAAKPIAGGSTSGARCRAPWSSWSLSTPSILTTNGTRRCSGRRGRSFR